MIQQKSIRSSPPKESAPVRAQAWLQNHINEGLWRPGERLPTLDLLAADAKVSRHTMWKAVGCLVKENVLSARRGGGIVFSHGDEEFRPADSWEDISHKIALLIYQGDFSPGTIVPPIAKLQLRFKVCYRTLHRALAMLVSRRILVRAGARYTVAGLGASGSGTRIVFFAEKGIEAPITKAMFPMSEQIAPKAGITLVRDEFTHTEPLMTAARQRLLARDSVAGCILDFWGVTTKERTRYFYDLLSLLYNTKKSIAIIDEVGTLELPEPFRSSKRIHVFTIASRNAGADVGRYLLKQGHRRCAFITTMPNEYWSLRRFEGLRHSFIDAGLPPGSVTICETDFLPSAPAIVCAAAKLSDTEMSTLFFASDGRDGVVQLRRDSHQAAQLLQVTQAETEQARRIIRPVIELYGAALADPVARTVRTQVFEHMGHEFHQRFMQSMFEGLYKNREITAWVTVADGIGRAAYSFLKSKFDRESSCLIPVVSFDNSTHAVLENISSYDFDLPGLFNRALSFAAGRAYPLACNGVTECPGVLCLRDSSGKV